MLFSKKLRNPFIEFESLVVSFDRCFIFVSLLLLCSPRFVVSLGGRLTCLLTLVVVSAELLLVTFTTSPLIIVMDSNQGGVEMQWSVLGRSSKGFDRGDGKRNKNE